MAKTNSEEVCNDKSSLFNLNLSYEQLKQIIWFDTDIIQLKP